VGDVSGRVTHSSQKLTVRVRLREPGERRNVHLICRHLKNLGTSRLSPGFPNSLINRELHSLPKTYHQLISRSLTVARINPIVLRQRLALQPLKAFCDPSFKNWPGAI